MSNKYGNFRNEEKEFKAWDKLMLMAKNIENEDLKYAWLYTAWTSTTIHDIALRNIINEGER